MGTTISSEINGSNTSNNKSIIDMVYYIQNEFLSKQKLKTLKELQNKDVCEKSIMVTEEGIRKLLTNIKNKDLYELEREWVHPVITEDERKELLNDLDINEERKERICKQLSKYNIQLYHLLSHIIEALQPVYEYTDEDGKIQRIHYLNLDENYNYKNLKIHNMNFCSHRLYPIHWNTNIDDEDNVELIPNFCSVSVNDDKINTDVQYRTEHNVPDFVKDVMTQVGGENVVIQKSYTIPNELKFNPTGLLTRNNVEEQDNNEEEQDNKTVFEKTFSPIKNTLTQEFDISMNTIFNFITRDNGDVSGSVGDVSGSKEDVSGSKEDVSGSKEDVSGSDKVLIENNDNKTPVDISYQYQLSKDLEIDNLFDDIETNKNDEMNENAMRELQPGIYNIQNDVNKEEYDDENDIPIPVDNNITEYKQPSLKEEEPLMTQREVDDYEEYKQPSLKEEEPFMSQREEDDDEEYKQPSLDEEEPLMSQREDDEEEYKQPSLKEEEPFMSQREEDYDDEEDKKDVNHFPSLESLYYDIYDPKTNEFTKMSDNTHKKYIEDLKQLYRIFYIASPSIEADLENEKNKKLSFNNIPITIPWKSLCNTKQTTIKIKSKNKLFKQMKQIREEQILYLKQLTQDLIKLLKEIFNETTYKLNRLKPQDIEKIRIETRDILKTMYTSCYLYEQEFVKLWSAFMETRKYEIMEERIKQLEGMKNKLRSSINL